MGRASGAVFQDALLATAGILLLAASLEGILSGPRQGVPRAFLLLVGFMAMAVGVSLWRDHRTVRAAVRVAPAAPEAYQVRRAPSITRVVASLGLERTRFVRALLVGLREDCAELLRSPPGEIGASVVGLGDDGDPLALPELSHDRRLVPENGRLAPLERDGVARCFSTGREIVAWLGPAPRPLPFAPVPPASTGLDPKWALCLPLRADPMGAGPTTFVVLLRGTVAVPSPAALQAAVGAVVAWRDGIASLLLPFAGSREAIR